MSWMRRRWKPPCRARQSPTTWSTRWKAIPISRRRTCTPARNFAQAAEAAGVQRIIYLGGLGDPSAQLSPHLRSRQETGRALCSTGVPVTELRAAVIVGSGSLSFEMIRYLTERLPVMICPRWVFTRTQPIAISNVLDYLIACLDQPASAGRVVEIGGSEVLTYGEMMLGYARARGLKRILLPVPVLTPRLIFLLAPPRDPSRGQSRPAPGRESAQRSRGARPDGATPVCPDRTAGLRHGREAGAGGPGGQSGGNGMERCPGHDAGKPAAGCAQHPGGDDHRAAAAECAGALGRGLSNLRFTRRSTRMADDELGLAAARPARSADRGRGNAPRPASSQRCARRRGVGLLAAWKRSSRDACSACGRR